MGRFDDDALLALIKGRVDEGRATGIVAGVLDADGTRRIVAYGDPGPGAPPLGPESVFEIGSVTKVFTGVLLAEMAARGEVDPDRPVQRYAPAGLVLPIREGREITLVDLASHRSGLPRLPANLAPYDPNNPYAKFSVAQMNEFLAGYELPREIGSQYEYSNLGAALLGHVLAARAGVEYETLVRHRILDPLGMTMTGVALSPAMKARLAIGHDAQGKPTSLWDLPTLAGADALRSTMKDLLIFLAANIGEPASDLERAMRVTHRSLGASPIVETGLAWHLVAIGHTKIVCHNGGTRRVSKLHRFRSGARDRCGAVDQFRQGRRRHRAASSQSSDALETSARHPHGHRRTGRRSRALRWRISVFAAVRREGDDQHHAGRRPSRDESRWTRKRPDLRGIGDEVLRSDGRRPAHVCHQRLWNRDGTDPASTSVQSDRQEGGLILSHECRPTKARTRKPRKHESTKKKSNAEIAEQAEVSVARRRFAAVSSGRTSTNAKASRVLQLFVFSMFALS